MFFAKINRLWRSLAFRLTLWYALIFVVSAAIVFALFYMSIRAMIYQRMDEDLLSKSKELKRIYALQGSSMLRRAAVLHAQSTGEREMFYRLFYPSGIVFSSSNMVYWKNVGIDRRAVNTVLGSRNHLFLSYDGKGFQHGARIIYYRIDDAVVLQMGYAMRAEGRLLQAFKRLFVLIMSGLLVVSACIGWFMARRALSGVATVTRTAQQISEVDLDARVPIQRRHNEVDLLAHTFNQMLDRIQILVTGIRQMNDNIAHDLRSPITRIRGLAEVTLTSQQSIDDYQQMAASTIEESDRLLDMINTMLTISRTERELAPDERHPINLGVLIQDACELFQPLAEDKAIELACEIRADGMVMGDRAMLQRLVANLIDNAIKYTDGGGKVEVSLCSRGGSRLLLQVTDSGIGIETEDLTRIFDRFFRGDHSRSQEGAGLGLSLARAIARAHGGDISVHSTAGSGSTFTVDFPALDSASA
ncbi:MAG: ATP-binding protein [Desulfobacteraceae bacterium]|jgi:heavy metal sensor kinase